MTREEIQLAIIQNTLVHTQLSVLPSDFPVTLSFSASGMAMPTLSPNQETTTAGEVLVAIGQEIAHLESELKQSSQEEMPQLVERRSRPRLSLVPKL